MRDECDRPGMMCASVTVEGSHDGMSRLHVCVEVRISIGHCDLQWGNGWFDVDSGGICSKEMGGHSCVANGVVSFVRVVVLAFVGRRYSCV